MDSEDAKDILDLLDKQDDMVVIKSLAVMWTEQWEEDLCSFEGCYVCNKSMPFGEVSHVVYIPFGDDLTAIKDSTHGVMHALCSTECLDEHIADWAQGHGVGDYVIGYHG